MHFLLIFGISLLSISCFCSFLALILYSKFHKKANSRIFFFNLISFCWNLISIIYRINSNFDLVKPIILVVGITLALISWLWLDLSLRASNLKINSMRWLKIVIGIIFLILVVNNSYSQIAIDLQTIETGLIRYKLSVEGSILFSFSFLIIFAGSMIQFFNFKNQTVWIKLSNFFMLLSLGGVIFPWKELGLNVILISLAGFTLVLNKERSLKI